MQFKTKKLNGVKWIYRAKKRNKTAIINFCKLKYLKPKSMKISLYLERINLLHKLLSEENTGAPKELAKRLGVSESHLYSILEELKMKNAPIEYDRRKKSYCYRKPFKMKAFLKMGFLNGDEIENISGGYSLSTSIISPLTLNK